MIYKIFQNFCFTYKNNINKHIILSLLLHVMLAFGIFNTLKVKQEDSSIKLNFSTFLENKSSIINAQSKIENNFSKMNNSLNNQDISIDNNLKIDNQKQEYVNVIAKELEKRKSRFSMAFAPDNVKTSVTLNITLDKNGNLKFYNINKNSGYDFFDKLAEKIVSCKKQFPTPPQEIADRSLEFKVAIIFDSIENS